MSAARVRRTSYGVQIIINGSISFEEALYALDKSLELYASKVGQAAINLGWREVNTEGMKRIESVFNKNGVKLLGVVSTSLTSNRSAVKLGYRAVIGKMGISEYQDADYDKKAAQKASAGQVSEPAEKVSDNNRWTKSVEIELPKNWKQLAAEAAELKKENIKNIENDRKLAPSLFESECRKDINSEEKDLSISSADSEERTADEAAAKVSLENCTGKIIAVTSGKGGTGCTSCCVYLAEALASLGISVCAADGCGNFGNMHRFLYSESVSESERVQITRSVNIEFADTLDSGLKYAAVSAEKIAGLSEDEADLLFNYLKSRFEYTLIDIPYYLLRSSEKLLNVSETILLIVNSDMLCISCSDKILSELDTANSEKVNILINRFNASKAKRGLCLKIDDAAEILDADILGCIPEDASLESVLNGGEAFNVCGRSKAACAYRKAASKINSSEDKDGNSHLGWLEKLRRILGTKI